MQFRLFSFVIRDPKVWNPNFYIKDLMRYQTLLLKAAGMCYINFEENLPKKLEFMSVILNWAIFVFFSFVHLHLALLFFLEMIKSSALEVITNAITMVIINLFAFFTLLYYKLNYKKYLRMVDFMNTNFLTRSAYGITFMTAERSYIVANRYTFWWTTMCLQGTLQWVIVPLFANKRTLPINLKYPMNELVRNFTEINWFDRKEEIFLISGWSVLWNYLFSSYRLSNSVGIDFWECK